MRADAFQSIERTLSPAPVGPRARDLVAAAATALRPRRTPSPMSAPRGDQREGRAASVTTRSGCRCPRSPAPGRAEARARRQRSSSVASRSAGAVGVGIRPEREHVRCGRPARTARSTSSGATKVRPSRSAHARDGALERERAADRGADAHDVELARRADELDQPALEHRVDVDAARPRPGPDASSPTSIDRPAAVPRGCA